MNISRLFIALSVLGLMSGLANSAHAKGESDISTIDKRRAILETAAELSKVKAPPPLPAELLQPFAPVGFDQPDGDEKAGLPGVPKAAAPVTDRELLKMIASQIRPSGTIMVGNTPMLMFGKKFVKVGNHFTVTYKEADYSLELTAVEGTNFTLRLNQELITRPIQPGKSP